MAKRALCLLLALAALFSLSVLALAEEEPDWRTEYLDFIVDDHHTLSLNERETTTYQVMYIASNEVPFIYISRGNTAGGGAFLYVDEDEVVIEQTPIINFEYVELSDAYFISAGRMGQYYDAAYVIEDSDVTLVGSGSYGGEYGVPLSYDTGAESVNAYTWNDRTVTREEYQREYYGLRDKYLTPEDEIIHVNGYGHDSCSYDEIIAWFMEQESSKTTVSGLYVDTDMGTELSSQINFDGEHQTFCLMLNLWEDLEMAEGTYSVDENGVVTCTSERLISSCVDNRKITDPEKLYPFHFLIDGDMLVPVEDGLGEGRAYSRVGDGFEVTSDSGTGTVTGNGVRVRTGPGTDYSILTALNSGDQVSITGSSGDWYRIECVDGGGVLYWGFMRSDYIARD